MKKNMIWIISFAIILIIMAQFADRNVSNYNHIIPESNKEKVSITEVIAKITATKTIIVKNSCNSNLIKIITDAKKIKELISIIFEATEITGDYITKEASCRALEMYDNKGKLIGTINTYINNIDFVNYDQYNRFYLDLKDFDKIIEI